jgi:hypothetical protein
MIDPVHFEIEIVVSNHGRPEIKKPVKKPLSATKAVGTFSDAITSPATTQIPAAIGSSGFTRSYIDLAFAAKLTRNALCNISFLPAAKEDQGTIMVAEIYKVRSGCQSFMDLAFEDFIGWYNDT